MANLTSFEPPERQNPLWGLVATRPLGAAMGLARDVRVMEAAWGLTPGDGSDYCLYKFDQCKENSPWAGGGVTIRPANDSDFDQVLDLQRAYELEEVLSRLHSQDDRALRSALRNALATQVVVVACEGRRIIGKAQTNARGICFDQLGGFYVVPERRNRGIAKALCAHLVAELGLGQGRSLALFAKLGNIAARKAYEACGFLPVADFRISYYSGA